MTNSSGNFFLHDNIYVQSTMGHVGVWVWLCGHDLVYFRAIASGCGVCSMSSRMAKFGKYEPLPRYLHSSGLVGGKVLTYSGRIQDFSESSKRRLAAVVEEFDPHTELWQQKNVTGQTPAPGMHGAASVAVKDDLFMFGGYDGSKRYI